MVNIYKAQLGEIRNESHFTLPGDTEFVLASEYAALEAERDELKRRIEQAESDRKQLGDRWQDLRDQLDAIIAIAEGRDNG